MTRVNPLNWYAGPRRIALTILAVGVGLSVFGVLRATAGMEVGRLEREVCALRLEALVARHPFAAPFSRPADACAALRVLATSEP